MAPTSAAARAASAIRSYLQDTVTTEGDRAGTLLDIVRQFYDFTKFSVPGGEGLDGRDGPERTEIGSVVEAADEHQMAAFRRAST